jgi:hypothetical protein
VLAVSIIRAIALNSVFRPEDVDSMFLRKVGIYRRVYRAPKPRRTSSIEAFVSV